MKLPLSSLAKQVGQLLRAHQLYLATAESCTGGGIAYALTQIPGSSTWFERGFVTYSNSAKQELLGVPPSTLLKYGAVSLETARAMAEGAIIHSHAQVSVAVTGIAGPDGGTAEKPVGTVWFAWVSDHFTTQTRRILFKGTRKSIREQSIVFALDELIKQLEKIIKT
jgi:nicotinamide-nucleotide amidase